MRTEAVRIVLCVGTVSVIGIVYMTSGVKWTVKQPPPLIDRHRNINWYPHHTVNITYSSTGLTASTTMSTTIPDYTHGQLSDSNATAIYTSSSSAVSERKINTVALPSSGSERARQLQRACRHLNMKGQSHNTSSQDLNRALYHKFIIDTDHHLLYCPIKKVASSFWKRVFYLLQQLRDKPHSFKITDVFALSGVHVHAAKKLRFTNNIQWQNHPEFLQSVRKFMFVRDPYEKLFSGFIDKIFTPTYQTEGFVRLILASLRSSVERSFPPRDGEDASVQTRTVEDVSGTDFGISDEIRNGPEQHKREARKYYFLQKNPKEQADLEQFVHDGNSSNSQRKHQKNQHLIQENDAKKNNIHTLNITTPANENWEKQKIEENSNSDHFQTKESSRLSGRRLPSDRSFLLPRCKLGVTFADFVRYVIKGVRVNEHFQPMWQQCPPCLLHYDFLGKMETFRQDVHSILTSAGVSSLPELISEVTFDRESDLSILYDVTMRTFGVIKKYGGCMRKAQILHRTWVAFQIRGLLSINQSFPLTEEESNNVTQDLFMSAVKHAYAHSGPRKVRMRQRKAAMLEAFYGLPRSLLKQLEKHVKKDCQLFGYECSVDKRFPPSRDLTLFVFHFERFMDDGIGSGWGDV